MSPPPRLSRADIVLMAHAICDADAQLENFKGRYRCLLRGCAAIPDDCVAYRQAKKAAEVINKCWRTMGRAEKEAGLEEETGVDEDAAAIPSRPKAA